jgi:hypothetical protein
VGSLFISYRQENSAQLQRVRAFAEELQAVLSAHGWNVILDPLQRAKGPDQGWAKWSADQVRHSDRVLIVVTAEYVQCMLRDEPEPTGLGAAWEARAIYHELHRVSGITGKYRALTFRGDPHVALPVEVGDMHRFTAPDCLAGILDWLDLTPAVVPPAPAGLAWLPIRTDFVHDLADRQEEFGYFQAMLARIKPERILLLQAASNHGKTGLIREFSEYAKGHLATATADLKGCTDSASLHRELRAELLGAEIASVAGTQNLPDLISAVETAAPPPPCPPRSMKALRRTGALRRSFIFSPVERKQWPPMRAPA